jgi:hypothetical protein
VIGAGILADDRPAVGQERRQVRLHPQVAFGELDALEAVRDLCRARGESAIERREVDGRSADVAFTLWLVRGIPALGLSDY